MAKINKKNPFVIIIAVFLLLVFLHNLNLLQPIERWFFNLVKPISSDLYEWGVKISPSSDEIREKEELVEKVNKLEEDLVSLAIDRAKYQELLHENEKLKNQLEFFDEQNYDFLMANVLAKEGVFTSSRRQDLIIDKGEKDGLRNGLAVLSDKGFLVGKIIDVKESSARVCLTTTPGCQFTASLQNEDQTKGLTDGRLGLTIIMDYIPQLEKISASDTVITSGLSEDIPRGFLLGKVIEVESESNEVWQRAIIEPLIDFDNLTFVSVVIP